MSATGPRLDAGRITLSEEGARIFGCSRRSASSICRSGTSAGDADHPEDRSRRGGRGGGAGRWPRYDVEYRVVHRTGEVRDLHSQGCDLGRVGRLSGCSASCRHHERSGEADCGRARSAFATLMQFSFDVYWEPMHSTASPPGVRRRALGRTRAGSEIGKRRWEIPTSSRMKQPGKSTAPRWTPPPFAIRTRATHTDGGKRYVSVSGLPVFDETGRFIGYRGVGRNITERKRAEEALRQSEAYLAEAQRLSTPGAGPSMWPATSSLRVGGMRPDL